MEKDSRLDLFLVWPPPAFFSTDVVSGIPYLTAYARNARLKVTQNDAAIGFLRYLVSGRALRRHSPPPKTPKAIRAEWKAVCAFVGRHVGKAFREGDFQTAMQCIERAVRYYNYRYPDTFFFRWGLRLRKFPEWSSRYLKPSMQYLMKRQDHPLVLYYRERVLPLIVKSRPKIVGISIGGEYQALPSMLLAAMIRKAHPSCLIVAGGRWVPRHLDRIVKHPDRFFSPIDAFVIGDGEPVIDGLKRYLRSECSLEEIENLYLPGGGKPRQAVYADIARQVPPEFDEKSLSLYLTPITVPVEMSRGCYWNKCAFCTNIEGIHRRYRTVRSSDIVRNMASLKRRYGLNFFLLSTLAASPGQLRKLVTELKRTRLKCSWGAWIRVDKGLTIDLLKDAMAAGCEVINLAPESFSQRTLDLMHKGCDAARMISLLDQLKAMGLPIHVNCIVGFPGESLEDLEQTFETCRIHGYNMTIHPFVLDHGSDVFRHPKSYGVVIDKRDCEQKDIGFSIAFRVRKGTPHCDWEKIRPRFIKKFRRWFVDRRYHGDLKDQFNFGLEPSAP